MGLVVEVVDDNGVFFQIFSFWSKDTFFVKKRNNGNCTPAMIMLQLQVGFLKVCLFLQLWHQLSKQKVDGPIL